MALGTFASRHLFDSVFDPWSTMGPFLIILSVSMARQAIADLARHRDDRIINNRPCVRIELPRPHRRLSASLPLGSSRSLASEAGREDSVSGAPKEIQRATQIRWQEIHVGDVLLVHGREELPADVLVIATSQANGVCHVETSNSARCSATAGPRHGTHPPLSPSQLTGRRTSRCARRQRPPNPSCARTTARRVPRPWPMPTTTGKLARPTAREGGRRAAVQAPGLRRRGVLRRKRRQSLFRRAWTSSRAVRPRQCGEACSTSSRRTTCTKCRACCAWRGRRSLSSCRPACYSSAAPSCATASGSSRLCCTRGRTRAWPRKCRPRVGKCRGWSG